MLWNGMVVLEARPAGARPLGKRRTVMRTTQLVKWYYQFRHRPATRGAVSYCDGRRPPMATFSLRVNDSEHAIDVEPDTPLLYVLRNDIGLNGPKFGCGLAQCGACTVLVDGKPQRSCVLPVAAAAKGRVTTIEGLGTIDKPHPLQRAFIDEQACQCGYC